MTADCNLKLHGEGGESNAECASYLVGFREGGLRRF